MTPPPSTRTLNFAFLSLGRLSFGRAREPCFAHPHEVDDLALGDDLIEVAISEGDSSALEFQMADEFEAWMEVAISEGDSSALEV